MYKTILGDEWDVISYKVYGSDKYGPVLMKANRKYAKIHKFSAGVELETPEIEKKKKVRRPPWKE